jgi:hypothetical protein
VPLAGNLLTSTPADTCTGGLRDVLAHHVIFAWNRLGLPSATQVVLAAAAKTAVFGPDPTQAKGG